MFIEEWRKEFVGESTGRNLFWKINEGPSPFCKMGYSIGQLVIDPRLHCLPYYYTHTHTHVSAAACAVNRSAYL
jgi:hypothetical protein